MITEKDLDRFWSKVDKTEGLGPEGTCWGWTAYTDKKGYGAFRQERKMWLAHRFSYTISIENPEELCVLHKCDNPPCVNPDHLFLGTYADNNRDRDNKGRCNAGKWKTLAVACKSGHAYTEENTITITNTKGKKCRGCRECKKESLRKNYYKKDRPTRRASVHGSKYLS